MKKYLSPLLIVVMLVLNFMPAMAETATGSFDLYVYGYEWGPAIPYIVLELNHEVDANSLDVSDFSVIAHVKFTEDSSESDLPHVVTGAALCDEKGTIVDSASSKYVRLDFSVSPDGITNHTYLVNGLRTGRNVWYDGFGEVITLAEGATLTSGGVEIDKLEIASQYDTILPEMNKWQLDQKFTASDGITFNSASFSPAEDDGQNALIVWLHGGGESGYDNTMLLMMNEADDIAEDPIQSYFGGAYVLAPQVETMYMDQGTPAESGSYYTTTGHSIYTEALQELVVSFVADNPDIDPNRIIIGGLSNGGFMTVNMLLHYPGYYCAGFPVSEAYRTEWITDEQIASLRKENIWFVHCLNDDIVDAYATSVSTVEKLEADGDLPNIKATYFNTMVDTSGKYFIKDGKPYVYPSHNSWIYVFNNEVMDNGVSLWAWLAQQSK